MERRQQRIEQRAFRQQNQQMRTLNRNEQRRQLGQDRRELRQLQARQQRELRGRNLNSAQRQQLRVLQRQQLQTLRSAQRDRRLGSQKQPLQNQQNIAGEPNSVQNSERAARVAQARQARFASQFQDRAQDRGDRRQWRREHAAARYAWRHGRRAAFVAWLGPVFYPYAYSDIFEYTFWPYAYDDAYWAYAYDEFFDGVFWGYGNPYIAYDDGPAYPTTAYPTTGSVPSGSARASRGTASRGAAQSAAQLCSEPGKGITAWPFAQIAQAVRPNEQQKQLLEDMKNAAADAGTAFKASCENDIALTPTGRLASMTRRLEATLRAVRTVRPALDAFYNSLSDEQKAHFTAIGPEDIGPDERKRAATAQASIENCKGSAAGLTDLPIEDIRTAISPNEEQREKLDKLSLSASSAVELLQASCPTSIPLTPAGRLEAMEKRLDAMVQAAKTIQPALEDFYASLTNEQKAQFNMLGRQAQRAN